MFNVNLDERDFLGIKKKGYYIEHGKNIITIRKSDGSPMIEIIYMEETNELLVMTKNIFHWYKKIRHISPFVGGLVIDRMYINENDEKDYIVP